MYNNNKDVSRVCMQKPQCSVVNSNSELQNPVPTIVTNAGMGRSGWVMM